MNIRNLLFALALLTPATALAAGGHGFEWSVHGLYIIDFLVLLAIIVWFARRPMRVWLEERAKQVQHEIEEARKLRVAAEERLTEYERRLAALEVEQKRILDDFVTAGERERDRIIREAEQTARKMVADAERRIGQEGKRLQEALEHEAVDLAVSMSEAVIRQRLKPDVQQRMITDYIAGLESGDVMRGRSGKDVFTNA
ncbi:MAG: hypothetical protein AMXMBFR64_48650 [Myxococcales bacterium]